jgi:hypothetical protein
MKHAVAMFALALTNALGLTQIAQANNHGVKSDPGLLVALRSDPLLRECSCILAARWLNESYPRIFVNSAGWKKLGHPGRAEFAARALRVAEATFLTEFGVPDQYEQVFIVDQSGRPLLSYPI